jgi:hypothetical protein
LTVCPTFDFIKNISVLLYWRCTPNRIKDINPW